MKLGSPKTGYNQRDEIERNRAIEMADMENHKRGRDIEVAPGRLILTDEATGARYDLHLDAGGVFLRDVDTLAVTGVGGGTAMLRVPFHADATANITMTNQANAEQFLANSNRNITLVDLASFTQYRLIARIVTGSASANSPRIYAEYKTGAFSTTLSDYSQLGTATANVSLASTGLVATAWTDLAAGAIADNVLLTVLQNGGDAVADPAISMVAVEFR